MRVTWGNQFAGVASYYFKQWDFRVGLDFANGGMGSVPMPMDVAPGPSTAVPSLPSVAGFVTLANPGAVSFGPFAQDYTFTGYTVRNLVEGQSYDFAKVQFTSPIARAAGSTLVIPPLAFVVTLGAFDANS